MSNEKPTTDEHYEWHEQVGRSVMFAMRCTHEGAEFGGEAVCTTCFDNTQAIGALVERFAYRAFEQGREAERDNPYCNEAAPMTPTEPTVPDDARVAAEPQRAKEKS